MSSWFVTLLIVIAVVKTFVICTVLYVVFRQDIHEWWQSRKRAAASNEPVCIYCASVWLTQMDEGQTHWDGDELVLSREYQCQHCQLPFWRVERVASRPAVPQSPD